MGVVCGTGQTFWLTGMILGDTTSTDHLLAIVDATAGSATTETVLMRLEVPAYSVTPTADNPVILKFPEPGYKFTSGVAGYSVGASGPLLAGTVAIMGYLE
jgi:hypothetical protein